MHADVLVQVAIAIVGGALFGMAAHWLRQPLILGYIAAGILFGQTEGLGYVTTDTIEPIAELGLILLLFMIGLEIDLKKLRRAGAAVATTGVVQFAVTVALGVIVFPLLGYRFTGGSLAPLYLAVAAALSSTMIVVKLLYDRYELDTSAGRVTLGILIFQDVWAILFLALQPDLRNPELGILLFSLVKGIALVAVGLLVSRYLLPALFRSIAKVPELLVIGALAWCFAMVLLATELGLSKEMGALIAGVALSTFPYNLDVIAKVVSLRDFFITLFFVSLGTKVAWPAPATAGIALAGAAFVILSRFLTITPVLARMGKGSRVAFISALNLSQVSEFSLVICTIGVRLGHVDQSVLGVVLWMMVITSVLSTYSIAHGHRIYQAAEPLLRWLRIPETERRTETHAVPRPVVFLGFARQASSLLEELLRDDSSLAEQIAVIDFNPEVRSGLRARGVLVTYGDISHADTLQHAQIHDARVVISTVADSVLKGTTNLRLLRQIHTLAPDARFIGVADTLELARELYDEGASYVLVPRLTGARELVPAVLDALHGHGHEHRLRGQSDLFGRSEVLP